MAAQKSDQLHETGQNDPTKLRGFHQALFIIGCVCDGDKLDQIVAKFNGDDQLVKMWLTFMKHNHWLTYDEINDKWVMTERAKTQLYDVSH